MHSFVGLLIGFTGIRPRSIVIGVIQQEHFMILRIGNCFWQSNFYEVFGSKRARWDFRIKQNNALMI